MIALFAAGRLLCRLGLHAGPWSECWGWTDRLGRRRTGHVRECHRCGAISLRARRQR